MKHGTAQVSTATIAAREPTLDDFYRAAQEARRLGYRDRRENERRMHPEDVMELRRVAEPYLVQKLPECMGVRFNGLTIIEDIDAPRLPRRAA